jgi:excisionase family DNA binding protein
MLEELLKETEKMLNFEDVRELLKVSTRSLRRYIADLELPHTKVGNILLFDKAQVQEWMDAHKGEDGKYHL